MNKYICNKNRIPVVSVSTNHHLNTGSLIGTTNEVEWQHIYTGAFADCKSIEKDYKNSFKKTKVIYQFNLPLYGIQIQK